MQKDNHLKHILDLYNNLALPVKASFWYLSCSILQKAIGFLTTPLFTRVMSKSDFGIVSMYNSWETIFTVICTLYLFNGVYNTAMIEFETDRDGFTSSVQSLTTLITVGVFMLYFLLSNILSKIIGLPNNIMLLMMVDIVFSAGMSFWSIRNRYEYKYKSVAAFTVISTLMMPIVSVSLVLRTTTEKATARIVGTVIVHALVYGVAYLLNLKRGKKIFNKKYWKYGIGFNLPLIPHYLSSIIMTESDRVVINNVCGSSYAAVYSISSSVTSIMNIVTISINQAITPWIYEKLGKKQMKDIGNVTYKVIAVVGTGFFLTSFIVPELVSILAPDDYHEAVWATPPLLIGMFLYFIYCNFGNVEIFFHQQKAMLMSSVIVAVFNIILDYCLVKRYGFILASYATMISYFLYTMLHYYFMRNICKKKNEENPYSFRAIMSIIVIFGLLIISSSLLYKTTGVRYVVFVSLLISGLVYLWRHRNEIKMFLIKK